ncbi:MAG: GDP-mannose 4,6-dehydratase, partial [Candidatus Bathyarchaeia archaeon]
EEYLAKPESPYGVSKLRAENYVLKYFKDFELKTVCLRYFNVYGPRQVCSDYSGVITKFLKSIEKNLPLTVFGDGEQTRDFVYIEDVVQANLLALKSEKAAGEVFNIGTGAATSINQLANMLLEIAGKKTLPITHCKAREGDIRHSVADVSKAREKIGYNPKVPLSDGLRKLLKAL